VQRPLGFEVYLFFEEPTDDLLTKLNDFITRNDQHQLLNELRDVAGNDSIAKLQYIYAARIQVDRLLPDRESRPKPSMFDGVPFGPDYLKPQTQELDIPAGAPSLPTMIESLKFAHEIQNRHFADLMSAKKRPTPDKPKLLLAFRGNLIPLLNLRSDWCDLRFRFTDDRSLDPHCCGRSS
jgi:hypothetical protein